MPARDSTTPSAATSGRGRKRVDVVRLQSQERTLRELADIRVLLDVPDVDREEVNCYFVRYGLEDLFDRLDEN